MFVDVWSSHQLPGQLIVHVLITSLYVYTALHNVYTVYTALHYVYTVYAQTGCIFQSTEVVSQIQHSVNVRVSIITLQRRRKQKNSGEAVAKGVRAKRAQF